MPSQKQYPDFPWLGLAALLASCAAFLAIPALAQNELPNNLVVPDNLGKTHDPLSGLRPPPDAGDGGDMGGLGGELGGQSAMPEGPPPKVSKRDMPRNPEPLGEYTEFFEKKVFAVPEGAPGQTLTYFFKTPAFGKKIPREKQYPLVLFLHDDKGMAHAAEYLIRKQQRADFPAYLVIPALSNGKIWAFPPKLPDEPTLERLGKHPQALGDAVKLVQSLQGQNNIDPRRIYVVGCSAGGFGAFGAAVRHQDVFAAAAPMSGGWTVKDAPKLTKFPLFVFHGELDRVYPPGLSRNVAFYIQQFGGRQISFIEVPGMANDCSNPMLYTNTLWHWLFQQKRKGS